MTVSEFIEKTGFLVLAGNSSSDRAIKNEIYCCDLLSYCMTRAPEDGVWITVMGNLNVVAVAALTDTAVVIISDGTVPDEAAIARANSQDVVMLKSDMPIFETSMRVSEILS